MKQTKNLCKNEHVIDVHIFVKNASFHFPKSAMNVSSLAFSGVSILWSGPLFYDPTEYFMIRAIKKIIRFSLIFNQKCIL